MSKTQEQTDKITVRIPVDMHEEIRGVVSQNKANRGHPRSNQALVRAAIEEWLENHTTANSLETTS